MISKKMEKAINEQINAELYSSYLYLAMAAHFEAENLPGAAAWMKIQAQEETAHAMKFFDFINERRGRVVLKAIDQPAKAWESPLAAFEAAYEHEQMITGRINDLVNLAVEEKTTRQTPASSGSSPNRSRRRRPLTTSSECLRWPTKHRAPCS